MSLKQGVVGSADYSANSRYVDGEGKLYFNPKRMDFPLITFLGMAGRKYEQITDETGGTVKVSGKSLAKRKVDNAEYKIFTDETFENATTINNASGYSSSASPITVTDGTLFAPNDQLYVPRTGEVMLVISRSTNALTVSRGVGSTAAALLNQDDVVRLGAAYPVNALSGTPKMTIPAENYNYTQIFRTPIGMGRTDKNSKVIYQDASDWERMKGLAGIEHLRQIDRALWFSRRAEIAAIDSSGTRQRATGGITQFVTSNAMDISGSGGTLTKPILDAFAEMVFAKGGSTKFLFCSPRFLSRINGLVDSQIRTTTDETAYGLNLQKYNTSHGDFILVRNQLFGDPGFATKWGGAAFAIDPEQIKMAYLNESENTFMENIEENDRDGSKSEWLMEGGLHLANETAHGFMTGVI